MHDPVFVYRCDSCSKVYAVGYSQVIRCVCGSQDRTHAASLDPRLWIAAMANARPKDRARMLRELKGGAQ